MFGARSSNTYLEPPVLTFLQHERGSTCINLSSAGQHQKYAKAVSQARSAVNAHSSTFPPGTFAEVNAVRRRCDEMLVSVKNELALGLAQLDASASEGGQPTEAALAVDRVGPVVSPGDVVGPYPRRVQELGRDVPANPARAGFLLSAMKQKRLGSGNYGCGDTSHGRQPRPNVTDTFAHARQSHVYLMPSS